ncbi:MAG: 3-hydroxyacyl-CoA dehydrogenase family protein [Actinomycetota bacterium]
MSSSDGYRRPAVVGSGAIGCALAASATALGEVRLLARSDVSAWRAEERAQADCSKVDGGDPKRIRVTTDPADLSNCDIVVEAVIEELDAKADLLRELGDSSPEADLASTTSSLPVAELATRSGHADRVFGFHVFNPVQVMELVELCAPDRLRDGVRERARSWARALGKTVIEVPDQPGFVVNRLLFPYLFDAVRLMERTGMEAADVDSCMRLGARYPMGPLRLLDFIGLDVAASIGQSLFSDSEEDRYRAPGLIEELIGKGKLGRKSQAGFYQYD